MMKRVLKVVVLAGLALVLLATTGCSFVAEKATEAAIEKGTGVKVDEEDGNVTLTGKDGSQVAVGDGEKGVELPEDWPEDVPVYEGRISTAMKAGDGWTIALDTADARTDVTDWYAEKLASGGWTVKNEMKTQDGAVYMAEKSGMTVQVTIADSNEPQMVTNVITWAGTTQ